MALTRVATTFLFLVLALAAAQPARHLQARAASDDWVALENEILVRALHGETQRAREAAMVALSNACRRAMDAPLPVEREEAAAHGEFLTLLLDSLTAATTQFTATGKFLDSFESAPLPPLLAARMAHLRGTCALRTGDAARVQEVTSRLGYLTDWLVMGPLDNERGGGFARAEAPEAVFDSEQVVRGKERDVRWRGMPTSCVPLGVVKLSHLFRPSKQVLAYARTTFTAPEAGPAVAWISSAEAVKLWVNGRPVFQADVRRSYAPDQNAVVVDLVEGSNEVLAKVCTQEKAWEFSLRLTKLDGTPLTRLLCDPKGAPVRAPEGPSTPSANPARGALAHFASLAGLALPADAASAAASKPAGSPDPLTRAMAAHRLALLLRARGAEDDADHCDREPARAAAEGDPANARYQFDYAISLRQATELAEERELNPFRRACEKAAELDPKNFLACRELYNHYTRDLPIADRARTWLEKAIALAPDNLAIRVLRIERLSSLGLDYEAEREEEEASKAADARQFAPLQARRGERALRRGRAVEAEAHFRAALKADRLSPASGNLRSLLVQQGRMDEAIGLLEERARLEPFETWPHVERARLETGRGDKGAVVAAYARAIEICPEDATLYTSLAHALSLFSDREGAVANLDRAIALDPKDRTARRYLEYLRANVKPFEDAFRVDGAEIVQRKEPPRVAASDEPIEVLYWQVAYKLNPDGTTQRYEHLVATVLAEEGAKRLATYGVAHDPGDEQVRIRRARVLRKDGRVDDAPAPPGWSWVKFPPLSVGDTIDVEARADTVRVGVFGNYFGVRHLFHALGIASTRHSEQIYLAPAGPRLHFSTRNGAPEPVVTHVKLPGDGDGAEHVQYTFTMQNLAKPPIESAMPNVLEFLPSVSVSTYGTWEEFTSWWWNLIEKECQSSPQIREKVAELVKGKTTREEKIRAIYDFVVTDVRYNAWEFGVHGYRPYSAATIFDRRYGDCKDKAILIQTMLREVGIDAYPVLIYADETRPKDDLTLPMVGLFNHCIAYVPAGDGMEPLFLDGTARNHPLGVLPEMDHGAKVVIVKGSKPVLDDVRYPEPGQNVDEAHLELTLETDGSAKGVLTLRPTGQFDVRAREIFGSEQGARKENLERMYSASLGRFKVNELRTSELSDLAAPVEITAEIEIEKFAKSKGEDFALPLVPFRRKLLRSADEATRVYDLLLGTPEADSLTIEYRLPPTWTPRTIPAAARCETPFGDFLVEATASGSTIHVRSGSSTKVPRVTPGEYAAFRGFARELDEAQEREIVLQAQP